MPVTSNFVEVQAALLALGRPIDLTRKRLGRNILDTLADRIRERVIGEQTSPDGRPLAPLKPATVRRKARLGKSPLIGVEDGGMLSQTEVRGRQSVTPDAAVMEYGVSEENINKDSYFEAGTARQAARPFYGLEDRDVAVLDGLIDEAIVATIHEQGGT